MISLEKWMSGAPLQKFPDNVGNLGKKIVATGFEWLPKGQKIAQSGHTVPRLVDSSVARFAQILPLWQNFKVFCKCCQIYLLLGKILSLLWQFHGQICMLLNGQILKKISSHRVRQAG